MTDRKNSWENKSALITGASSGIGEAIAIKLALEGIKVHLVARHSEKLQSVAASIIKNGGSAYIHPYDLTLSENRISLVNEIISDFGIPDILINNAGIGWYGYYSLMPWNIASNLLSLNIEAPAHLSSLLLQQMQLLPKARIINIGSVSGKMPEQGIALYSASKAFLDSFTTSLYREMRGTNLTVSVLRAGSVKTNFFDNAASYENGGRIPAESFAISPERIAEKVWRLIEHPARYAYVPAYLMVSPLLESLFSWAIDLVGPVLLRHQRP